MIVKLMIKVAFMIRPMSLLVLSTISVSAQITGNDRDLASPVPKPNRVPDPRQSILISGKVVLSDGSLPTEAIKIELVYGASVRTECRVNSKGEFSFLLGPNNATFNDASNPSKAFGASMLTHSGRSEREHMVDMADSAAVGGSAVSERELLNCELRANLAGYRSDSISLAQRRLQHDPNIGTIVLRKISDIKGRTTSVTTAGASKEARQAFERGLDLSRKRKFEASQVELELAVKSYPAYAVAWSELGRCFQSQQKFGEARAAFQKSIDADPYFMNTYEGMSLLAARENNWAEVLELTDKIIHLNPYDFPGAYYYNAIANLNFQKLDLAERNIRESIRMDPTNTSPRRRYILALVLAQKEDFANAIPILQSYLKDLEKSATSENNPAAGREATTVRNKLIAIEKLAAEKRIPPSLQ